MKYILINVSDDELSPFNEVGGVIRCGELYIYICVYVYVCVCVQKVIYKIREIYM